MAPASEDVDSINDDPRQFIGLDPPESGDEQHSVSRGRTFPTSIQLIRQTQHATERTSVTSIDPPTQEVTQREEQVVNTTTLPETVRRNLEQQMATAAMTDVFEEEELVPPAIPTMYQHDSEDNIEELCDWHC